MNEKNSKSSSGFRKEFLLQVVGGIVLLIAGVFIERWVLGNSPPNAVISPTSLTVEANTNTMFSAEGSSDPNDENDRLEFRWTVGGIDPNKSHIANCDTKPDNKMLFNCRFFMPGTHNVSITVIDSDGAESAASASVTLRMEDAYFGLVFQFGLQKKDINVIKAVMYAVDWPSVQTLLQERILILYDPDIRQPVYASTFKRNVNSAKLYAEQTGGIFRELWLEIPDERGEAVHSKIMEDLKNAGIDISVQPLVERWRETDSELGGPLFSGTPNFGDIHFVDLSDPSQLIQYYKGSLNSG